MLFRLILYGFLFYAIYKFLGNISSKLFTDTHKTEVKGQEAQKGKIDLSQYDVEDADFEDITE